MVLNALIDVKVKKSVEFEIYYCVCKTQQSDWIDFYIYNDHVKQRV